MSNKKELKVLGEKISSRLSKMGQDSGASTERMTANFASRQTELVQEHKEIWSEVQEAHAAVKEHFASKRAELVSQILQEQAKLETSPLDAEAGSNGLIALQASLDELKADELNFISAWNKTTIISDLSDSIGTIDGEFEFAVPNIPVTFSDKAAIEEALDILWSALGDLSTSKADANKTSADYDYYLEVAEKATEMIMEIDKVVGEYNPEGAAAERLLAFKQETEARKAEYTERAAEAQAEKDQYDTEFTDHENNFTSADGILDNLDYSHDEYNNDVYQMWMEGKNMLDAYHGKAQQEHEESVSKYQPHIDAYDALGGDVDLSVDENIKMWEAYRKGTDDISCRGGMVKSLEKGKKDYEATYHVLSSQVMPNFPAYNGDEA